MTGENENLPSFFKSVLWSYDFSAMDADKDKRRIIINTINHGQWRHWQWIFDYYGKEELREFIKEVPKSEFTRESALKLVCDFLGIRTKDLKYETRAEYIQTQKDAAEV